MVYSLFFARAVWREIFRRLIASEYFKILNFSKARKFTVVKSFNLKRKFLYLKRGKKEVKIKTRSQRHESLKMTESLAKDLKFYFNFFPNLERVFHVQDIFFSLFRYQILLYVESDWKVSCYYRPQSLDLAQITCLHYVIVSDIYGEFSKF